MGYRFRSAGATMKKGLGVVSHIAAFCCWLGVIVVAALGYLDAGDVSRRAGPMEPIMAAHRLAGTLFAADRDGESIINDDDRKAVTIDITDSFITILQTIATFQEEIPRDLRRRLDVLVVDGIDIANRLVDESAQTDELYADLEDVLDEMMQIVLDLPGIKLQRLHVYTLWGISGLGILLTFLSFTAITRRKIEDVPKAERAVEPEKQATMENLAESMDPLTGAMTRAVYELLMPGELHRSLRYGHPLSILAVQVDRYDALQDVETSGAAPYVLSSIGETISANTRASDLFARTGESHFVVVLPETHIEGASRAAEKIRKNIELFPYDLATRCTVSIGITQYQEGDTEQTLLLRAVGAAEVASSNGGNRIEEKHD